MGPFEVEQIINLAAVRLRLPASMKVHPLPHLQVLQVAPDLSPPTEDPPPIVDGAPAYTVLKILNFLVDWEGYGPVERSWIPRCHILDRDLFLVFHQDHPDKPCWGRRGEEELSRSVAPSPECPHLQLVPLISQHTCSSPPPS